MQIFVTSIREALAGGNHLAALVVALSLPDICAGCETPDKKSQIRYQSWFEDWVEPKYTGDMPDNGPPVPVPPSNVFPKEMSLPERQGVQRAWTEECHTYMARPKIPHVFLSARDCYALRCAMTHEGSDQTDRHRAADAVKRFEFVISPPGSCIHMNRHDDRLQLDVAVFCHDICTAVEAWEAATIDNPQIIAEKARLLSIVPFGVWAKPRAEG